MQLRLLITNPWLFENGAVSKFVSVPGEEIKKGYPRRVLMSNMMVKNFEITNKETGEVYSMANIPVLIEFLHACKVKALSKSLQSQTINKTIYDIMIEAGFDNIKDLENKKRKYMINIFDFQFEKYKYNKNYLIDQNDILDEEPDVMALLFLLNDLELIYRSELAYKRAQEHLDLKRHELKYDGSVLKYWAIRMPNINNDYYYFARPYDINRFVSYGIKFWYHRVAFNYKLCKPFSQFLPYGLFTMIKNFHGVPVYKFEYSGFLFLLQIRNWYKNKAEAVKIAREITHSQDYLSDELMKQIDQLCGRKIFQEINYNDIREIILQGEKD